MGRRIEFNGPAKYRLRSMAIVSRSVWDVTRRRAKHGPRLPGWNWLFEVGTEVFRRQLSAAFQLGEAVEARRFLDAVVLNAPAVARVHISPLFQANFKGSWFVPEHGEPQLTMLYLHGGGYAFNPRSYNSLIAMLTLAAKSRTLALDYRLAPEYRFRAQLDDALNAYRWLLENGTGPERLVVAGDSAGGNLTLALLLSLRELKLPLPALAIALSPATDFSAELATSGSDKAEYDWIDERMAVAWADWFCGEAQRRDPLVSPIYADLRGLPPIYIQAGRAEILYESIRAFAERAKTQGADVVLEAWDDMNHDFQMFGYRVPQSREALRRFGEVIEQRVRREKQTAVV